MTQASFRMLQSEVRVLVRPGTVFTMVEFNFCQNLSSGAHERTTTSDHALKITSMDIQYSTVVTEAVMLLIHSMQRFCS